MKNGNKDLSKISSGKNGYDKCKIPILKFPKAGDVFICFMFNENIQSIESYEIDKNDKNSNVLQHYLLEKYPVETCKNCQCKLTLSNLAYNSNNETIELYCKNCCEDKGKILDLSSMEVNDSHGTQIIKELNSYLEINEIEQTSPYKIVLENLIIFTTNVIIMLNYLKNEKAFHTCITFMENYLDSLSSYIEIVKKLEINYLYLVLKNFMVVSTIENDERFFQRLFTYYIKNINGFNISEIHSLVLKYIDEKNENNMSMLSKFFDYEIEKIKNKFEKDVMKIKVDFYSVKLNLIEIKNSWLKKKVRLTELKGKIIDFLRNYNYSFNYISSKKVLERKFINGIIYDLFKHNHGRFQKIKEDDNIINSIQKEIQNIIKFLEDVKDSKKAGLIEKLNKEITSLESRKNIKNIGNKKLIGQKYHSKASGNTSKKNYEQNEKLSLTKEEKALLDNYLFSNTEDSYSRIFASESNNSGGISHKKIQVILEFLFFVRDKTIRTIHLLNESSSQFFDFLNICSLNKNINKNDNQESNNINTNKNVIANNSDDEDDNEIEELKKDFNCQFLSNYKEKNEKLFKSISIETKDKIKCSSALNYIFSNTPKENYAKVISYLYENVVLPERNEVNIINKGPEDSTKKYYAFKQKIDSIYNILNDRFKADPSYECIIDYFKTFIEGDGENIDLDASPKMKFYENNVDNFNDFKEIYIIKQQIDKYIKMIESEGISIEKLKNVKKKYKFINKEIKNYLEPYEENYVEYYEEWKSKNSKFVIENYQLKELIADLNLLIPGDETISVVGKDKKNFYLILYLFQSDYFLKDYI